MPMAVAQERITAGLRNEPLLWLSGNLRTCSKFCSRICGEKIAVGAWGLI